MELNKWKNYIWNILERRMVIIMNLSEFLENWDGNTQIVVKTDTEEVFCGKVADVSVDIACRYSIPKAGVKHNREIMHIIVEHNGKEKAIDFSKRIKNRVQKWKGDLLWRIDYFYYIFRVIMMEMKSLEYMMIYRS